MPRRLILGLALLAVLCHVRPAGAIDKDGTYKFIDVGVAKEPMGDVIGVFTITKVGDHWTVTGDFYWTKGAKGANAGARAFGFKAKDVKYDADQKELQFESMVDPNPLKWSRTRNKLRFLNKGKLVEMEYTYDGRKDWVKRRLIQP